MRGGIGLGNTCKPMAVSFQCMTKYTTIKKKKKKVGVAISDKIDFKTEISFTKDKEGHLIK